MDYETLRYEKDDGVARIILDRSPRNALNLQMAQELMHAATRSDEDAGVRVVLISGAGGTFGSGGDLKEFSDAGDDLPLLLKELATYLHAAVSRLVRMRAPVIAAVEGAVAGGGISLMLASDVVLAAESASFRHAYSAGSGSPRTAPLPTSCRASWYCAGHKNSRSPVAYCQLRKAKSGASSPGLCRTLSSPTPHRAWPASSQRDLPSLWERPSVSSIAGGPRRLRARWSLRRASSPTPPAPPTPERA